MNIIERVNSLGMKVFLSSNPDGTTTITCQGKTMIVKCSLQEMSQRYYNWQMKRQFVQVAFDNLSAGEREFLMTGTTPEEWAEMWKDVE